MINLNVKTPAEFADICPIEEEDFKEKVAWLVEQEGYKQGFQYLMPNADYEQFKRLMLSFNTRFEFQNKGMRLCVEQIVNKTTSGLSITGENTIDRDTPYTFISNHRDIVLDATLLNLMLVDSGHNTAQVAIGDNLLIYDWITTLVRLNKSFVVKRGLGQRAVLEAAIQLSKYIHFTLTQRCDSVWIAQRQGRSKDSTDNTQESLIKMLALGGKSRSLIDNLMEINLAPVAISYEYDPCDFLKAVEFLQKKRDPNFKKSQSDDLVSMSMGLRKFKGRVHYGLSPCINEQLAALPRDIDKNTAAQRVCQIIDQGIHANYRIYPGNYIAYDRLNGTQRFADQYTAADIEQFDAYINGQVAKVRLDLSEEDRKFIIEKMLVMYSNPLANKLAATAQNA